MLVSSSIKAEYDEFVKESNSICVEKFIKKFNHEELKKRIFESIHKESNHVALVWHDDDELDMYQLWKLRDVIVEPHKQSWRTYLEKTTSSIIYAIEIYKDENNIYIILPTTPFLEEKTSIFWNIFEQILYCRPPMMNTLDPSIY